MIDDIVAMLDGSIKKGDGHINLKVDENVILKEKGSNKRMQTVQLILCHAVHSTEESRG